MSGPEREQRLVFGEIAEEYDTYRPSYPDDLFDAIIEFGSLQAGDRSLEIGAGTGKATVGFLARGLLVHALEPSAEMATILRGKGVDAEETLFESWEPPPDGFRLAYAAQAWHWVGGDDRYERVAAALEPGGTVAFFWNRGREWEGALAADNDAAYDEYAPHMTGPERHDLSWVADGIAACARLEQPEHRTITWGLTYTRDQWVQMIGTHSDHRMLAEAQRARLHAAVGDAIDRHGGQVDVVYDVELFLSRRV